MPAPPRTAGWLVRRRAAGLGSGESQGPEVRSWFSILQRHNPNRCPWCGATLERKTAYRGRRDGEDFLGCTAFPECRYSRPIGPPPPVIRTTGSSQTAPTCVACRERLRSLTIPPPHRDENKTFWYCVSDSCPSLGKGRSEVRPPTCPGCGRSMFPREGKLGSHAGRWFWRCPGCDTRPLPLRRRGGGR